MPCYQRMKRKEREEFIKKNRRDINLYANITNFVKTLIYEYYVNTVGLNEKIAKYTRE